MTKPSPIVRLLQKGSLITRRRTKWVGTAAVGLLIAFSTCSFFVGSWAQSFGNLKNVQFVFVNGHVDLLRSPNEYFVGRKDFVMKLSARDSPYHWWPQFQAWGYGDWFIIVPLWIPLLLIAAPTAWLWRTDRRAKPWQCAKCRYDLRGIEGGVCPECGESKEFQL